MRIEHRTPVRQDPVEFKYVTCTSPVRRVARTRQSCPVNQSREPTLAVLCLGSSAWCVVDAC